MTELVHDASRACQQGFSPSPIAVTVPAQSQAGRSRVPGVHPQHVQHILEI